MPPLFGSKQDVSAPNFLPRTLSNFRFSPASSNYRVPAGWRGKLKLIFALKDGTEYSKVRAYVRSDLGGGVKLPKVTPTRTSWRLGG